MKRLLSLLSFVCLFVGGSYATIVVEKLWENTTDAPTNAKVCCGWDGVLYAKNYSGGVIYAYSATGRTTFASEGNSPWGVAMDEAGNMVSRTEASYYTASPGKMNIYVKGSATAIPITFSGISGRSDYITADGDFTSADGGKVYFYPNSSTEIKYVLIQNANASSKTATVSVGTLATGQSTGNSESYVLMGSARGTMAHVRTAARKIIGGTIPSLSNVNNNATGTAIMTIKTAADVAQEIWAYPTSNTKATFNVRNITTSANVAAATGTGFYIGSSGQATGSNSVWMSTQKISDYCYYLYVIAGNNATACFRVYENAPANLAQAVAGKTIRRSILNNGSLFVLAIDDAKEPYLYKVNPETQAIEAVIPTTGLSAVTNSTSTSGITTMPLSDIAFTDDNVLIGCQAEHMTSTATGTFRVYKWTSLDAAPTLWFGSNETYSGGNWYNSISGVAMTYVGSSTEGQVIALANSEASNEYRFVMVNVSDGSMSSTIFNRSIANGGGTSTILTTTIGIAPQLIPSPYESDFILLGSVTPPIAVTEVAHNSPATYGRTDAIPYPSVGSTILTVDDIKYMAVPSSEGVKIYDITSGLASATLEHTFTQANTATFRYAAAVQDAADLVVYFQTDGTITKLTATGFFTATAESITLDESTIYLPIGGTFTLTPSILPVEASGNTITWSSDHTDIATVSDAGVVTAKALGDATITATVDGQQATCAIHILAPVAHIYAYDLSRELSTTDFTTYTFKFKPNTDAPAGGNNIVFYKESDGSLVGRIAISGALTAGTEKSVVLTKAELPACDEPMTWAVELTGADSKVVGQYLDNSSKVYDVYSPRGVVVNNCPESNNFGKLYISNALSGTTTTGSSQTQGIFVFDAKLGRLSPANQGYTGGVSWPSGNGAPYRIVADEDGNIYISGNDADVQGVWMMAADPSQNFSKIITAKIYGFDVVGSGSSRVLYGMEAITVSSGNLKRYAFGSQIPFTGSGETIVSSTSLKQVSSADNIISDGNGGFWISQNRATEIVTEPILIHITSNGTINYNSFSVGLGLTDSRRGALALNKDKTRLAVSTGAGYVAVYDISYNGSGVPSLTKIAQTTAQHGNIDGIAFDYAGNLFIVSASDERLYAYALPMEGSNTSIVPAKASLTVTKAINVPATGVSLNKTETSLLVGASETLVATVLPTEPLATNQVVTWESDNEDVVTVSSTGELTAIHDGTATITVTSDDGGFTATCEVTVTKTAVTSVTLNHTSYDLPTTGTVTLTATVAPDNASYPTVTWATDDDAVATVTSAGVVTAVGPGTATITATADGVSNECTIVVSDPVARIFAYDLRSELDGSDYKLSFKSNIPYTSGNIILYDNGEQYGAKIPITANPMTISRSSLPEGKELTWAVELSADANKHVGEFTDASRGIYNFYLPQGVAVDNSTESDYFGRIYITEPNNGSSDGATNRTKSQKAGLFVYDPQLNELNTTNQGYNLGLTMPQTRANFHRVAVDEAGMVYVNSTSAIYQANPAELTASTAIGSGLFTNLHSFAVTGAGDERLFCTIDNANTTSGASVKTLVAPFTSTENLISASTLVAAVADNSIVPDGKGGWWTSQNRYSADGYSLLSHISSTGVIDFTINNSHNTALAPEAPVSYRGVVAVNREGTLLALGSAKTVQLYDITYVAGVPSLTKSSIVMPNLNSAASTNIDGLAFDYVGNLYVVCATTERFYAFTLPTDDNTCIVPAKSTLTLKKWDDITLDETDEDNLDVIAANDGRGLNVILKRPFTSTEHWYTLVLPFDVTAEQLAETFGAGTEVAVLQESRWKTASDLYLHFVPQSYINAGEPCLFKPARAIEEEAVFRGVTIDNATPRMTSTVVNMEGMYAPTEVEVNDVNYYLGNTNYLHLYVDEYKMTKGFRAYFHFNSPLPAHASARVVFHEEIATDIEDLPEPADAPAVQKVIRDGQLIIIRDGREFNAQGQLVR